jgi:hypothetical protein
MILEMMKSNGIVSVGPKCNSKFVFTISVGNRKPLSTSKLKKYRQLRGGSFVIFPALVKINIFKATK